VTSACHARLRLQQDASKLGWVGRKEEAIREGTKALGLGESSRAIDALRQAVEAGYTNFGWMQNDPDLASLRDHPEFVAQMQPRQL
jgi:hypothetical protein